MTSTPSVCIGSHTISREQRPFVIAEMSGNHNGDLGRALQIVDAVAQTGEPSPAQVLQSPTR